MSLYTVRPGVIIQTNNITTLMVKQSDSNYIDNKYNLVINGVITLTCENKYVDQHFREIALLMGK